MHKLCSELFREHDLILCNTYGWDQRNSYMHCKNYITSQWLVILYIYIIKWSWSLNQWIILENFMSPDEHSAPCVHIWQPTSDISNLNQLTIFTRCISIWLVENYLILHQIILHSSLILIKFSMITSEIVKWWVHYYYNYFSVSCLSKLITSKYSGKFQFNIKHSFLVLHYQLNIEIKLELCQSVF